MNRRLSIGKENFRTVPFASGGRFRRIGLPLTLLAALVFFAGIAADSALTAQTEPEPTAFKIGERLTYAVSLDRFPNVAYAEIYVASRGRLSNQDAVEIRAKFKTLEFVSAAFYLIDETRTTFVAADTGLPLYLTRSKNIGGIPQETNVSYLTAPTPNVDLLALIYKVRYSGGSGGATLSDGEKTYGVTFQPSGSERIKTDPGEYDTIVVSVQSEYFTESGIRDVRVNLSTDDAHLPVMVRFRTAKGEFKAKLSSVQTIEPEVDATPVPIISSTPRPANTPRVVATPTPYVANVPLSPDLAFELGETLNYRITAAGRPVGAFTLEAKERRQVSGTDSLLLNAVVTEVQPGVPFFAANDFVRAQVDPDTLLPRNLEIKFSGSLSTYNRTAKFDGGGSFLTFNANNRVDTPVGTHSIISLLYALRSFNLKPSRDLKNPVNDTRVAVFWENQPYVFTLRPSEADSLTVNGEKVSTQIISVTTGNPVLDQMKIKIWLSNDERRVPLRITVGPYQADLVSDTKAL
jgi:hypothetical protein